jgi:uncharacterized protein YybS (DUF2232 family)
MWYNEEIWTEADGENAVHVSKQSIFWSGILALALVVLVVPGLNYLALLCIMFPVAIIAATHSLREATSLVVAVLALAFIIYSAFGENYMQVTATTFMPLGWLPVASLPLRFLLIGVMFVVPGVVLGYLYQQAEMNEQPMSAFKMTGMTLGVYVALVTVMLGLISWISGSSVLTAIGDQYKLIALALSQDAEWKQYVNMIVYSMQAQAPLLVVLSGAFLVWVTHLICGRILRRQGREVPRFVPMRDFYLPTRWVPYLCILLVLCFFFASPQSTIGSLLLNVMPLLMMILTVQAIGFFFYLADNKKWPRAVPIVMAVLSIFMYQFYSMIGMLDALFPKFRRFLVEKRQ